MTKRSLQFLQNLCLYIPFADTNNANRRFAITQKFPSSTETHIETEERQSKKKLELQNQMNVDSMQERSCYKFLSAFKDLAGELMGDQISYITSGVLSYGLSNMKVLGVPEIRIFGDVCRFWDALADCTADMYHRIISDNGLIPGTK